MHSDYYRDLARLADERGTVISAFCEITPTSDQPRIEVAVILHNPDMERFVVATASRHIPDPPQHPDEGFWRWGRREWPCTTRSEAYSEFAVKLIRDRGEF